MSADLKNLPRHVAIIMDGNGRWAAKRLLARKAGHAAGSQALEDLCGEMNKAGFEMLTVYAFSTENWKRSPAEVADLMDILRKYIRQYLRGAKKNDMRVTAVGDLSRLEPDIIRDFAQLEEATRNAPGMRINVAVNYGGRDEIVRAAKKLAAAFPPGAIDEAAFSASLDTAGLPDPEIIVRTGGESRLSNFLLWQAAYSELFFSDKLWPDFRIGDLMRIIEDFQGRERRYGGR